MKRALAVVALAVALAVAPAATAAAAGSAVPAGGRVLVLRPHRLDLLLDGRVVRSVVLDRPVELGDLPWLAGDAAYAAPLDDGGAGVRLGAVLVQEPGTALAGDGLRLELVDTAGAGPARLTGTAARLTLRRCLVTAGRGNAGAGLRYADGSDVTLEDVTLRGLGRGGRGGGAVPALAADAGSGVALRRVSVAGGGRGVQVRDPARLVVDGLDGDHVAGALLDVAGGSGARLAAISSSGATGPAVRLRGAGHATLDGLTSTDDALALAVADADGLRAAAVHARGSGLVVGGRDVELVTPDVDAPDDALRVGSGGVVTVRGGLLRGGGAAVAADGSAVLERVTTGGALRGPVRIAPPARAARPAWWDRPVRGTGLVAVVALVAVLALEVLRGRSRQDGSTPSGGPDVTEVLDGDLALDLGEQRVH